MSAINKIHSSMSKCFIVVIVLLCHFFPRQATAQIPSFVMSSVGLIGSTSSNSAAIQFKSVATCLDVQTGIAVLSGQRATGQFAINCEVTMNYNTLGIKMYPNPVLNISNVKFQNTPPLTEVFNLSIWTLEGNLVSTKKETGYNLFQGITLNLSALNAGSYVLKIEASNYMDALKFIKAN